MMTEEYKENYLISDVAFEELYDDLENARSFIKYSRNHETEAALMSIACSLSVLAGLALELVALEEE